MRIPRAWADGLPQRGAIAVGETRRPLRCHHAVDDGSAATALRTLHRHLRGDVRVDLAMRPPGGGPMGLRRR